MAAEPDLTPDAAGADDFYIGYLPQAPAATARFMRRVLWVLAGLIALTALVLSRSVSSRDSRGHFAYGELRTFTGVLYAEGVPMLRLTRSQGDMPPAGTVLLVGFLKHGIPDAARAASGQVVRFQGTLIHRQNLAMVEITDIASLQVAGPPRGLPPAPPTQLISRDTVLTGELVDTKCYFGVMRPGEGKCHRACAVVCLSGGVPPGLLIRDAQGYGGVFLLVGADGKPLPIDPQLAARQLTVRGGFEVVDGVPLIRVDSYSLAEPPAADRD